MKRKAVIAFVVSIALLSLRPPVQAQVSFFQPPTYAGAGANTFVADFNSDGKLDILTADGTMNLSNGDGTFKLGIEVSGGVLAVADFNGDGRPDVLQQGTGTLLVLLGNGDGTFQAPVSTASGANLSVVAAGDLNGDGSADVVGVFNSMLLVYLSKGDGTFATGVSYTIGATATGQTDVSLGDFNGDHIPDIVVTNGGFSQEIFLPGRGDGTFGTAKTSTGIQYVGFAAPGDFNGDGKLDLALSSPYGAAYDIYVLQGNGDGTFQAPLAAFAGNGPLAVADVNGDGKLDLILQEEQSLNVQTTVAQIYLGIGNGTFFNPSNYVLGIPTPPIAPPSLGVKIADLNSDGKLDIAAGNAVLLSNGDGTFQGIQYAANGGGAPFVIADFDKGGALGLANAGVPVRIYRNNGGGMLSLLQSYFLQGSPGTEEIVTTDLNGDGNLDLLVSTVDAVGFTWSYSVLIGNGDGSFQAPVYYALFPAIRRGVTSIVAADFRNSQKMDVAMAGIDSQSLELLLGNGDGTFAAPIAVFDGGGSNLVSADFNGDGKQDIAAGGAPTAILFGNGDGTFQPAIFPTNLENFAPQLTADLNGDGKPDLISYNQVALGNGDGTFTVLPGLTGMTIISTGDLNGDGRLDLIVYSIPSQQIGILLGNGDGTFGSTINVLPQSDPIFPILAADMNGDGRADAVFPWGNGYGVLLNTTPAGFEVSTTAVSPTPITAGNSATSTVSVIPTFGFNSSIVLSCAGLPTGASCGFNPPTIADSSGKSTLTITTTASIAAGNYPVQVQGSAGSVVNNSAVSLVIQAAPDFAISGGSPTSQIISAGQTASFSLSLAGSGTFSGVVHLTCAITPAVTASPTCNLSSSSVQISGGTAQSVTVNVGTSRASTAGMVSNIDLPRDPLPFGWISVCTAMLVGLGWLALRSRARVPVLAAAGMILAVLTCVSCGSSSSSHNTQGTPPGTYAATVTATSGTLAHNVNLTVTVQ